MRPKGPPSSLHRTRPRSASTATLAAVAATKSAPNPAPATSPCENTPASIQSQNSEAPRIASGQAEPRKTSCALHSSSRATVVSLRAVPVCFHKEAS